MNNVANGFDGFCGYDVFDSAYGTVSVSVAFFMVAPNRVFAGEYDLLFSHGVWLA
jgi:hypothetical protein